MNKYDKTMTYSSLYIIIPIYCVSINLKLIMSFQIIFSLLHWKYYNNKLFHNIDIIISSYIFIHHLSLIYWIERNYRNRAIIFAILTLLVFNNRKGYREKALKKYKIIYVIPHALFRYLAFWFIMSIYKKDFNINLSILYWISIYRLAY